MNKKEMLKKLLVLSKQGVEGEKINAENLLNKLLKKYNLTLEDIEETEAVYKWEIKFSSKYEKKLVCQICYMLFPDREVYTYVDKRLSYCTAHLTNAEYIEFEYAYSIYKEAFSKELDLFYMAFIQKNHMFPSRENKANDIPTIEDRCSEEDRIKISMMASGIERQSIRPALDCK